MALNKILPQGPNVHCGQPTSHEAHANLSEPTGSSTEGESPSAYCDGVPLLESFAEIAIRVPLQHWSGTADGRDHEGVLAFFAENGLGVFVDALGKPDTATLLRVRSEDGVDKVYPLLDRKDGKLRFVQGVMW